MAESREVVGDLAQDVNRESASAHNDDEEAAVDQEVTRVKKERHDVEDKLLFEPLLLVAKLKERDLVLEVRLDCFEKESAELKTTKTRLLTRKMVRHTSKPIIK